jgi:hypothetical protein
MEKVDADFNRYHIVASVGVTYHLHEVAVTFCLKNQLDKPLF